MRIRFFGEVRHMNTRLIRRKVNKKASESGAAPMKYIAPHIRFESSVCTTNEDMSNRLSEYTPSQMLLWEAGGNSLCQCMLVMNANATDEAHKVIGAVTSIGNLAMSCTRGRAPGIRAQ